MSCFTRFVNEYKESFNKYGFDRGFWTYRQLAMLLFKVGILEYEIDEKNVNYISNGSFPGKFPQMRMWRNWQTRRFQVPVVIPCRFNSCHPHQNELTPSGVGA